MVTTDHVTRNFIFYTLKMKDIEKLVKETVKEQVKEVSFSLLRAVKSTSTCTSVLLHDQELKETDDCESERRCNWSICPEKV